MNSEQEFKCVFCSETFENKETLQVHFRKHADPNFKTSQSEEGNSNQRFKDQAELVECDVCPEVFTSISKAITHKHKFHPDHDAKYFCPWCGKLFTMKHLYSKHILTNHSDLEKNDDKQFPCDICNVVFNVPAAMLYHNKFFHRQDTDLPSIGTSKKLKLFNQEVVQIYYCPFCGEEYENKVNLHNHICEDHNDENQRPDDIFRCPLCDAVFYHLDAYELHLTHHTVDDMYSETNELADQITDFSLESVPPIAEKVENSEEIEGDKVGIEQLLELAMDEPKEKKSKKHKKHKKSKKSAITLDEFFSMNKDVFGEEIDFQGVEEVPTQVVAKKLKAKKPPPVPKLQKTPDIQKLMKQGIVVKKNPAMRPVLKNPPTKISQNLNAIKKSNEKTSTTPDNSSSADALSKLLNQSNTQLKIVRKSNNSAITEQNVEKNCNDETPTTPSAKEDIESSKNQCEVEPNVDKKEDENELENQDTEAYYSNLNQPLESKTSKDIPTDNIQPAKLQVIENKTNSTDPLNLLKNNTNLVIKSTKPNVKNNEQIKLSNKIVERYVEETDDNDDDHELEHDNTKTNTSFDVLKHLSHLTVKSNSQFKSPGICKTVSKLPDVKNAIAEENTQQMNTSKSMNDPIPLPYYNYNKETENKKDGFNEPTTRAEVQKTSENKIASILNNPHLSIQTKSSPIASPMKESPKDNYVNRSSPSNKDLLKNLKNVTAKPINKASCNVRTPQISPNIKKEPKSPPAAKTIENIEIFNIDDSDTDEEHKSLKNTEVKQDNSVNNIKMLNKNITIKSVSQNTNNIKRAVPKITKETVFEDDPNCDDLDDPSFDLPDRIQIKNPIQKVFPNALKNLSKNITIKSRNLSPQNIKHQLTLQNIKRQNLNLQDDINSNDEEEDVDLKNKQLKITEMENMSDDELPHNIAINNTPSNNVKVQHPDDSDIDNENDNTDNEFDNHFFSDEDIEEKINFVKVMKNQPNNSIPNPNLNTLKKLSKDITIKSSNDTSKDGIKNTPADDIPPFAKSLSNQISIKNMRGNNRQENANTVINPTNIEKTVARQANQKVMSNQVNTKEVKTVKRFQTETQTVIEEITTTVTKTIKTVNQTIKQETRQESGQCSTMQTIQRFPNQPQKNYQGVKVRQAVPLGAPRVRNFPPSLRVPCNVRAANQTVPVRPQFNAPGPKKPRMAGPKSMMRPPRPPPKQTGPSVKTLALPNNSPNKRLNTEDTGHFSCFKKPKESLIPVDELPMSNSVHEPGVHFSKSVQMNKSNYTCTTSAMKGDAMITSTQTRSEMSSSSQHLSKLKNMSGLSIVKTSQVKQAHVEEKSEMSASQKNTLEAIMKLQSKGLLVKKPRMNVSEDNEGVESDDAGHDSNEEYDDE